MCTNATPAIPYEPSGDHADVPRLYVALMVVGFCGTCWWSALAVVRYVLW